MLDKNDPYFHHRHLGLLLLNTIRSRGTYATSGGSYYSIGSLHAHYGPYWHTHTHTRTPSHSSTPTHTKKCARTVTQTHTHTPLHLIACARHRDKDCHPSPCRGNAGGLRNGSQKAKREYGANFWQAVACKESTEEQMHSVTNNLPLSHPNYHHHQRRFLVIM